MPDRARLEHAARTNPAQVDAHEHRDRNRQPDRHRSPWTRLERVDDDERRAPRCSTIMMPSTATSAVMPATGPISSRAIWPSDLPSRRTDDAEDHEVLHRAAERDADDDPDDAGQIAELRGERRADERARVRRSRRSDGRTRSTGSSGRSRGRRRAARPASAASASSAKIFAAMNLL